MAYTNYSTLMNGRVWGGFHKDIESAREEAQKRAQKWKMDCEIINYDPRDLAFKRIETIKYEKPKRENAPMEYKGKDSQGNYIYEYKYKRKKPYKGAKEIKDDGTNE